MTSNNYLLLNKELLEQCFKDLASLLKKRVKNSAATFELIVVGGASIVLNYNFRMTTMDIDCADNGHVLMNDVINIVAEKHNLPNSWINADFMKTNSYSPKLSQYSTFYRSYGNGVLNIRTIKDEYLLAMKVVSGRKYKNDYSDIYGIIASCKEKGKGISEQSLESAIVDLYGSLDAADEKALEFAKKTIDNPINLSYREIKEMESKNATVIKTKIADKAEQSDIDYILSKLEIQ